MAKLTDIQVKEIRASDLSQAALARAYGVSQATISRVKRGLARQTVEDDMTDEQPEATEAAESTPAEEPMSDEETVEGVGPKAVHLGDGRVLLPGDVVKVNRGLATALVGRGLARVV